MDNGTSRHMEDRVDVLDYLQTLEDEKIYYCPNPGNAGDSAIALGTYQVFEQAGLSYELVRWDEDFDSAGRSVMYGGGGNLRSAYPQARTFIERHHSDAEKLVLLPHTVQGHKDLLSQLGSNVDIFCRERRSFEWVAQHTSGPDIYLGNDLAFRLEAHQVLANGDVRPGTLARWIVARPVRGVAERVGLRTENERRIALRPALRQGSRAVLQLMRVRGNGHLHAFRTDREKAGAPPPAGNVDVSWIFAYGAAPQAAARQATQATLAYLDQFERIATNRLHLCILAALLGKEVDFYANSDFKNEAVYEFSIKDNYSNVRWRGRWTGEER